MYNLKNNYYDNRKFKKMIKLIKRRKEEGIDYFESIERTAQDLNYQLNIVPKYNMISNCGIDEENTHSTSEIGKLPRKVRKLFFMKRYEINSELKHPKYVIPNIYYENQVESTRMQELLSFFESCFLHLIYKLKRGG